MRTFYRIETLNLDEDKSLCGYMETVIQLLNLKLGVKKGYSAEELQGYLKECKNPIVKEIMTSLIMLCAIPIPDIYKDNSDMYCLYRKEEFKEAAYILNGLWNIMFEVNPAIGFRYKKFKLKDEEILYEDLYQIVITKEIYEKHINDSKYAVLP